MIIVKDSEANQEKGIKFDGGKPRWGLLPMKQMEDVVKILTFGAEKYSDDNWKHVDNRRERYYDAMMRHATQYRMGETYDEESGLNHLGHAICNMLFLMWMDENEEKA